MAQLLIKNFPRTGGPSDFDLDDIVMVAEDTHQWGAGELDPAKFRIINLPGTRAQWSHLTELDPATLRDTFPRSMVAVQRLQPAMTRENLSAQARRQRRWKVDGAGNPVTKAEEV